jgi:hypothetical protein
MASSSQYYYEEKSLKNAFLCTLKSELVKKRWKGQIKACMYRGKESKQKKKNHVKNIWCLTK